MVGGSTLRAVDGVSLDLQKGELVSIIGPSGCGKSTLLRMVAGLETVSGGEIRIGDRVVNQMEPMERDIAMVFQNYALYPHMNCYNNMAYGLKNRRVPKPEIERRVKEAARILELEEVLSSYTIYWPLIFGPFLIFVVLFAREGLEGLFSKLERDPK